MGQLAPVFIPVSDEPHRHLVWGGHSCPRCQFPFHILGQPQSVTPNQAICDDFGRRADRSVRPTQARWADGTACESVWESRSLPALK
jgi:hypothetical protein